MITSLLRYSILLLITVLILTILSFVLAYLFPGDVLTNLSGISPNNEQERLALVQLWALDQSVPEQFFRYCQRLLAGDWGVSIASGLSLREEIGRTLPATIELSLYAIFLSVIIGVPLGCIAGLRSYSKLDYAINSAAIVNYSMPVFWLGLAFIIIFSLQLGWLPLSGRISLLFDVPPVTGFILVDTLLWREDDKWSAFTNALAHLAMPACAVALITAAALIRLVRRSVIDVLMQPHIASARSRGLTPAAIFFHHILRNALLPVIPSLALQITTLVTNAIIVETLFSWPGIGDWLLQAIYQQDYSAIRLGVLVVSTLVITLTILVDLIDRLIDPSKRMASDVAI